MQVLELPQPTANPEQESALNESNAYFREHGGHPYFIGAQFHPELLSRPIDPAPMFMGLVAAAIQHANPGTNPQQIAPRWLPDPKNDRPVTVYIKHRASEETRFLCEPAVPERSAG